MSQNRPIVRRLELQLGRTGTGWISTDPTADTTVPMKFRGIIRAVRLRMDTGAAANATMDIYITDGSGLTAGLSAVPDGLDTFYSYSALVATAHATTDALDDNLMSVGGTAYEVSSQGEVIVALNITAGGAGANTYNIVIEYEAQ